MPEAKDFPNFSMFKLFTEPKRSYCVVPGPNKTN